MTPVQLNSMLEYNLKTNHLNILNNLDCINGLSNLRTENVFEVTNSLAVKGNLVVI